MNIKNGVRPIAYRDHRTYDFHKTFGSTTLDYSEFSLDSGLTMRDQNADGYPQGCTGYTQTDCATDQDKLVYEPKYTYEKTLMMDGQEPNTPASVMTSLKSTTVYGVQETGKVGEEFTHRRAPYFIIKKLGNHFDGIVSAMRLKHVSVSCASPWPQDIERAGSDGVVTIYDYPMTFDSGHNYKVCGIKKVGTEPRLIVKSWQGNDFGDKGFCYFSRTQINKLLSYPGSGAFANVHADGTTIQAVTMTIMETIISYLRMIIAKL